MLQAAHSKADWVVFDHLDNGFCLGPFSHLDVVVDLYQNNTPILIRKRKVVKNDDSVDRLFASLEVVIRQAILGKHVVLPPGICHLLDLMNKDAHKHLGVIKFHSCLVPPMNMRELATRMKIQLFKLKKISQADYSRVLKGLLYPPDWEDLILRYRDLIVMYNSRGRWSQTNNQIPPAGLGQSQLPVGLAQGQGQPQPSSRLGQSQGLVNAMSGLPLPPQVNKGKGVAWAQGKATSTATTVPPVPIKPQPHAGLAQGQGQPQPSTRLGQSQGLVNAMSGLPLPPQSNKGQATGTAATVPIKGQVPFQGSNKQTGATSKNNKTSKIWMIKGSNSPLSTAAASSPGAPASTALPGAPTMTNGSAPLAPKAAAPIQTTVPAPLSAVSPATASASAVSPPWPQLLKGKYNAPNTDPDEEVVRYNRNIREHGPDLSFSEIDTELMMEAVFPYLVPSFC